MPVFPWSMSDFKPGEDYNVKYGMERIMLFVLKYF